MLARFPRRPRPDAARDVGDSQQRLPDIRWPIRTPAGMAGMWSATRARCCSAQPANLSRSAWPAGTAVRARNGASFSAGDLRRMRMMTDRDSRLSGSLPTPAIATAAYDGKAPILCCSPTVR